MRKIISASQMSGTMSRIYSSLFCSVFVALSTVANAGETTDFTGKIAKVDLPERLITVEMEGRESPIELELTRRSKVFSRGVIARPDEIKVGDKAKIRYDTGLMVILSIEVNSVLVPLNLEELNGPEKDYEPIVSRDGLEIFWSVEDSQKKSTIWYSKRKSPETVFAERKQFYTGHAPVLSADGLQIYFRNNDDDSISLATRKARDDDFARPATVSSLTFPGLDPIPTWLSDDGLSLYVDLMSEGASKKTDHKSCYVTKRESISADWLPPKIVDVKIDDMPNFQFSDAVATSDDLQLYCVSNMGLGVLSRKEAVGPFTQWSPIKIDSTNNQPLYCTRIQYVPATRELFLASNNLFAIPSMKRKRWMDLWVIKDFQPSAVR